MRQLTKSQKKLLDQYVNDNIKTLRYCDEHVHNLPNNMLVKIIQINDTEILYQNIQHYIDDKIYEK